MARQLSEGFESGDFGKHIVSPEALIQSPATQKTGVYRCILGNSGTSDNIKYQLATGIDRVYVRASIFKNHTTGKARIIRFLNSTDNVLVEIKIDNATSRLEAYVGTTLVATGTVPVPNAADPLMMIEAYAFVDQTLGEIKTRVNGIDDINFVGDTDPFTTSLIRRIQHYPNDSLGPSTYYVAYDNIAINDTSGAVDSSWPGEVGLYALVPNGAGTYTQIANAVYQGGDTQHWQTVDDVTPHNSTEGDINTVRSLDYVWDSVVGNKDSYALTNAFLPADQIVKRVHVEFSAKQGSGSAGTLRVASFLRTNGVDFEGAEQILSVNWKSFREVYTDNPQTGTVWTPTELDAAEVGIVIKGTGTGPREISNVRLVYETTPVISAVSNFAYFQLAIKVFACLGGAILL